MRLLRLSLISLTVALLAALVAVPSASAQDQELTIEFVDRPQHHGKGFKVTMTGLDPSERLRISECVGDVTGDDCVGGWGADPGQFDSDDVWHVAGLRWHFVDGEIADCAEVQCSLEVTNGAQRARRPIEYSTKYPMPSISGDFDAVAPGQVVAGKTNRFVRANKFGRNVGIMQCVTDSSPLLIGDFSCETVLANTQLVKPFQVTPLRSVRTADGQFDCTAAPGSCELRVWSYPSPLALPAGAPLTFVEGGDDEPEVSATLSKSADIKPFEKLTLTVTSPYTKLTIAICARSTDSKRATCNKRRRTAPGLVDGQSSTISTLVTPGRFVTKAKGSIDCAEPDVECHLRVISSNFQIAKIPLSFDASVAAEPPQMIAPEGPFTEGETIEILLRGLKPNSQVLVDCWSVGCEERTSTTADADGTAVVAVTLERDPDYPDKHRQVSLKTQPKVRPSWIPIVFR